MSFPSRLSLPQIPFWLILNNASVFAPCGTLHQGPERYLLPWSVRIPGGEIGDNVDLLALAPFGFAFSILRDIQLEAAEVHTVRLQFAVLVCVLVAADELVARSVDTIFDVEHFLVADELDYGFLVVSLVEGVEEGGVCAWGYYRCCCPVLCGGEYRCYCSVLCGGDGEGGVG